MPLDPGELDYIVERVLDRLGAQQPDTYAETLLTVNPDGTISANFTGNVNARGFSMLSAPVAAVTAGGNATPPQDRLLRILTDAGVFRGGLWGNDSGEDQETVLDVNIGADIVGPPPSKGYVRARAVKGANPPVERLLVDTDGKSSFPRMLASADRVMNWGQANLTFPTAAVANTAVIAHGLGVTPQAVVCSGLWKAGAADAYVVIDPSATTNVNFSATGRATVALNGTWPFYWLAIG